MGFLFRCLFTLVAFGLIFCPAALARTYNHTIIIYATVPKQRGIYVDKDWNIIRVAGNTSDNINPLVFSLDNRLLKMNQKIQKQYDEFLIQHDYHLIAGEVYKLKIKPQSQITIAHAQQRTSTDGFTLESYRID